jgi:hypothetical protein
MCSTINMMMAQFNQHKGQLVTTLSPTPPLPAPNHTIRTPIVVTIVNIRSEHQTML